MKKIVVPNYEYQPGQTFAEMLKKWLDANSFTVAAGAVTMKTKPKFVEKWLNGGFVYSLPASRKISEITGIDLEKMMVIEAVNKSKLLRPDLNKAIDELAVTARQDLVEWMRQYSEIYGLGGRQLVAEQLGLQTASMACWFTGKSLPGTSTLKPIIIGLADGLIECASRDDAWFILYCRKIFGSDPENVFLEVKDFRSALEKIFGYFPKTKSVSALAVKFGIKTNEHHRLAASKKRLVSYSLGESKSTGIATILTVMEILVRKEQPHVLDQFLIARDRLINKEDLLETISLEKISSETSSEAVLQESEMVTEEPEVKEVQNDTRSLKTADATTPPETSPVQASTPMIPTTQYEGVRDETVRSLLGVVGKVLVHASQRVSEVMVFAGDELQKSMKPPQKKKPKPKGHNGVSNETTPTTPLVKPTSSFEVAVGQTIEGVDNCLSRENFTFISGGRVSARELDLAKEGIRNLRTFLLLAMEIDDPKHRRKVVGDLRDELQEFWLADFGLGVDKNESTFWRLLQDQRNSFSQPHNPGEDQ